MKYAVCEYMKDGRIFPVNIDIETIEEAQRSCGWMKIGRGQFEDWRAVPMHEVDPEKLDLSCFTEEAQKEKRASFEAERRVFKAEEGK